MKPRITFALVLLLVVNLLTVFGDMAPPSPIRVRRGEVAVSVSVFAISNEVLRRWVWFLIALGIAATVILIGRVLLRFIKGRRLL